MCSDCKDSIDSKDSWVVVEDARGLGWVDSGFLTSLIAIHQTTSWLVVLTILKNISQWEGLSHVLWKIKKNPNHQPARVYSPDQPGFLRHGLFSGTYYKQDLLVLTVSTNGLLETDTINPSTF